MKFELYYKKRISSHTEITKMSELGKVKGKQIQI